MTKTADPETLKKLSDMIKHIQTAMLTSEDGPHLRARPMVAAQQDFDGELFFYTHASAHKVREVGAHERVGVSYADSHHQLYVSLSGTADVLTDKALIKAHWSEPMRTWFPEGIDDPDIAILKVTVDQAEYWDAPSSAMVHLFGYVKAVTTGQAPHPGENEKVTLG
jgi:general stress protein 26